MFTLLLIELIYLEKQNTTLFFYVHQIQSVLKKRVPWLISSANETLGLLCPVELWSSRRGGQDVLIRDCIVYIEDMVCWTYWTARKKIFVHKVVKSGGHLIMWLLPRTQHILVDIPPGNPAGAGRVVQSWSATTLGTEISYNKIWIQTRGLYNSCDEFTYIVKMFYFWKYVN